MAPLRKCSRCQNLFPATSEYFHSQGKRGLRYDCKKCRNKIVRNKRKDFEGFISALMADKKRAASRKHIGFNLSADHLKEIFRQQDGFCAISGIPMKISSGGPFAASLDRIDSREGYVIGNVQFLCTIINIGKQRMSTEMFASICLQVVRNQYGDVGIRL